MLPIFKGVPNDDSLKVLEIVNSSFTENAIYFVIEYDVFREVSLSFEARRTTLSTFMMNVNFKDFEPRLFSFSQKKLFSEFVLISVLNFEFVKLAFVSKF